MTNHNFTPTNNEADRDNLNRLRETASNIYARTARHDSLKTDLEHRREGAFGVFGTEYTDFDSDRDASLMPAILVKSVEQLDDGTVKTLTLKLREDGHMLLKTHERLDERLPSGNIMDNDVSLSIDYDAFSATGVKSVFKMKSGDIVERKKETLSQQAAVAAADQLLMDFAKRVEDVVSPLEEEKQRILFEQLGSSAL